MIGDIADQGSVEAFASFKPSKSFEACLSFDVKQFFIISEIFVVNCAPLSHQNLLSSIDFEMVYDELSHKGRYRKKIKSLGNFTLMKQ
jgi:hypothetical protein